MKLQFEKANYSFVVLSVLMSLTSHIIRSHRWGLMLEPLGFQPGLLNRFLAVSVAYLMNLFIPKSGEVTRAMVMKKYEKIPFDKGFGTIISERIIDLIFLLLFTIVAVALEFEQLFNYVNNLIPFKKLLLLFAVGVGSILIIILLLKRLKSPIIIKINQFLLGLKDGILSIFKIQKKGAFIVQSLLIWALYVLSFYFATKALEATSQIEIGTVIIGFVVGSFAFAFTNSGVGYYPLAIAGILFIFGIPETTGSALGWIVWTSNILYIILAGVTSFVLLPILNKKKE